MTRTRLVACLGFAAWFTLAQFLPAQEPAPVALHLTPAAEATPAMKFQLLPDYIDRREANAAPVYLKAFLILNQFPFVAEKEDKIHLWLQTPPEKLPRDEVRAALADYAGTFRGVASAARCERCVWDLGVREAGKDLFGIVLPEVDSARRAGRLLALKARWEIAEHRYDDALATLQSGYALSRHVAAQPFLVSGLVGAAISAQMSQQLAALVGSPDAPNMYWAIAALPRPLIDSRHALELEGSSLFVMYPELRDIERKELHADEWRDLWRKYAIETGALLNLMGELKEAEEPPGDADDLTAEAKRLVQIAMADALLEKKYPAARRSLIDRGFAEKDVEAMAKPQAVLIDEVQTFKTVRDEYFKWAHLPYWQAREGFAKANAAMRERAAKRDAKKREEINLVDLLLPAIGTAAEAFVGADQRLAALQTIEAVRMHAAAHEGRLPRKLDEITAVPVPLNPFTGKPPKYEYSMDTGAATLRLAHPHKKERELIYELQIRK